MESDAVAKAQSALQRFLACMEALPPSQAEAMRQQARAAIGLT